MGGVIGRVKRVVGLKRGKGRGGGGGGVADVNIVDNVFFKMKENCRHAPTINHARDRL